MRIINLSILFSLTYSLHLVKALDYDGWLNIQIEHNLNCNSDIKYCPRGTISLKSIRSGTSIIEQKYFSRKDIEELKALAEEDGFYTMRTLVTSTDYKDVEFLSSVKAQLFLDSGLSDIINVWLLPSGTVMSVGFQVNNASIPLTQLTDDEYQVNSNFYLRHVDQAPVPDTASYIQKLEREREAREKGDQKDNRSFFVKYWMYIVPIAIFVMISGATNPEAAPQAAR